MALPSSNLTAAPTGGEVSREWLVARAMSQLPGVIWVQLAPDGTVLAWNAAAAALFDPSARHVLDVQSEVVLADLLGDEPSRVALAAAIARIGHPEPCSLTVQVARPGASVAVKFDVASTPTALGGVGLALIGCLARADDSSNLGFAVADARADRLHVAALDARRLLGLPRADPDRPAPDLGALPLHSLRSDRRKEFVTDLGAGVLASADLFVAPHGGAGRTLRLHAVQVRSVDHLPDVVVLAIRDSSSLRSEVVTLEQRERRLRRVVEATSSVTGRGFLRSLVRSLSYALGVRVAYVAERVPHEADRMRMLCLWSGTEFTAGYSYQTAGTLDELVIADGPIRYDDGLPARLAADSWLRAEGLVSYFGVPIPDSAEQVVGVLGVMGAERLDEGLPVTEILGVFASRVGVELERLRAEEALRESEERWRSLVENAPDVILALDRDACIRFHNLAGFDGAPELGDSVEPRIEDEDRERFRQALDRVTERREPASVELRARLFGGAVRWYSLRVGPLHGGDRSSAAIVVATDIDDAKRREALAQRRSVLEQMIATLSTRFLTVDHDYVEDEIQAALGELGVALGAESAFVYRFDEAGTSLHCTQTWATAAMPLFPPVLGGERPLQWLVERTAGGQETVFGVGGLAALSASERQELAALDVATLACVPLRGGGTCAGLLGFAARAGAEAWDGELLALVRIAGDLTASILERARETERRRVLERELRHSQRLEAIGTLAGGIAHDFNNLLTGILGNASLLQSRAAGDPDLVDWARSIEESAQRAAELTRKMQRFGRRREADFTEVDVHGTIAEVVELLRRTFPPGIAIAVELEAHSATVRGDATLLSQVVLNLAVNARDALPTGGHLAIRTRGCRIGTAEATAIPELSPGQFVAVEVVDDGVGMAPQLLDRIFDPFFTTKDRSEGRGMGLATVYGIVRKHGGTVRVESEPGRGTTLTVLLPLSDASPSPAPDEKEIAAALPGRAPSEPVDSAPERAVPDPAEGADGTDRSTPLVMVVDDENIVLLTATAMLESLGYATLTAESGERAVEHFQERAGAIDLVLLDLMMPGMDGRECLRRLRAIDPRVRVVLSSGWGFEGIVQELRDAGIIGFANKPYGMDELDQVVREALGQRPASSGSSGAPPPGDS